MASLPTIPKATIPKALRNAVWVKNCGKVFHYKCQVSWCQNIMTPFDFETGHNIPESKGGATTLDNLRAICSQCNKSMGNRYTIDEFSSKFSPFNVAAEEEKKKKEKKDKKDKKEKIKIFSCFR